MPNHKEQSKKLQTKYLIDQSFKQQVDARYKKYQILLNQSIYSDLSSISQDLFLCYNRGDLPIYFYFGMLQNSNQSNLHKLAMYFVRFFVHRPTEDFTFVFINTKASSEAYGNFKSIFLQLTMDHFLHLKQFILLRPSYFHRAQDYISFGVFSSHLKTLTRHFYSGMELCSYLKINQQDFVDLVPKQVALQQFPKLKARKLSLQDQRINFQGQLMGQHQRTLRKQFETVMKSFLIVKPGQQTFNLQDYQLNKFGIPVVLQMLIFYFKTHQQGLMQQGLFRKSVSIDQQNQTLMQLVNKNYDCLLKITNPHIVANLIKRFFANLKIPIIPFKQFHQLMHDQGVSDKKLLVKQVVNTLPELNFITLIFLLQFLKQDVISNAHFNKMTAQNIAICFAPCLLRAEKASAADLIYASKCAIVCRVLLENFQFIFGDNRERYQIFRRSQDKKQKQTDKQIHQNVEAAKNQRLSGNQEKKQNRKQKINEKQEFNTVPSQNPYKNTYAGYKSESKIKTSKKIDKQQMIDQKKQEETEVQMHQCNTEDIRRTQSVFQFMKKEQYWSSTASILGFAGQKKRLKSPTIPNFIGL